MVFFSATVSATG